MSRLVGSSRWTATTVDHMFIGFPAVDPVGPDTASLPEAVDLIASLIAPLAAEADRCGVRREAIDALADAGLHGALPEPASTQRELVELLAGADASTWFCWTQHQSPLRALNQANGVGVQHRLLRDARTGRLLCGVAFAHLRRSGPPNPIARRTANGWVVDGTLDWVTSWDIADWFLLAARIDGSDDIVSAMLPAGRGMVAGVVDGLVPGPKLDLLAMSGTHTRPLRLDGVRLHPEDVLNIEPLAAWQRQDAHKAANANPAAFGIARGALADLYLHCQHRSDPQIADWLDELVESVRQCRRQAYTLADIPADPDDPGLVEDLLAERRVARARSLQLAQQATTAVIVAQSGRSMATGSAAERRAREALFMHVQAQTTPAAHAYAGLARERNSTPPLSRSADLSGVR